MRRTASQLLKAYPGIYFHCSTVALQHCSTAEPTIPMMTMWIKKKIIIFHSSPVVNITSTLRS